MQKSLRAGTKRPLTMVLVNASEALPATSWNFGDQKVDRAEEPAPETAWSSLD